ncbi:TonB-dependent receptor plug domain-containing protein [Sandarakinorhabdus rubra]|uniref:TonB-dependent receptor plug domain-containing protein n=1 Tax=Sandarakinorhabdus rubra TaxID=2672568 RepID=UPI0013DA6E23|nr:TonB-dependent receptor [Sandarakinorhabdus rubra]
MTVNSNLVRRHLLLGAALPVLVLAAALPAAAQEAQVAAEPAAEEDTSVITVTGSRISRTGYDSPIPVSVIGEAELKAEPQANIGDFVNTLPSVRGSLTSSTNSGSLSNGQAGLATVNLRSLGAARTLVLIDGQRSVASTPVGFVDTQTVPQGLIKGVEVVTGGASSAYGSDAVAGVVNFSLNRDFKGLRAEYEFGITDYGDVPNHTFRITSGFDFGGGRGKLLLAGDYFTQKGVDTYDRPWQQSGFFQIDNPAFAAGNGQPERFVGSGIGTYEFTPGGIINAVLLPDGPDAGTALDRVTSAAGVTGRYFGNIVNGTPTINQFTYGPRRGQWMIGGDYLISREGHWSTNSLAPNEERGNIFGRLSYEFSPAFTPFVQYSYSAYQGQSFYQQTPSVGVQIRLDNAYLPASIRNAALAANPTAVAVEIGTSNAGFPAAGSDNKREVYRFVAGADGEFELGKGSWKYTGYYQVGIANTRETLTNTWRNSLLALAQDAVFAPAGNAAGIAAGTIVCRSTLTSPTNGCVPLNRIGVGGVTQAAIDYVFNNGAQPQRLQTLRQDVAALSFSTNDLFETWAGPVSFATGGEWRRERVSGFVDPQFNSGWLYGNYLVTKGSFTVWEVFGETVVPLAKGLDFNGAIRRTEYSTSGGVTTWKLGATWQPIPDIKFRVVRSRDIRAPNLNELFAPGTARTNTVNVPLPGGGQRADEFTEQTTGNLALTPEVAATWGVGGVFTPSFLPGFAASVDYFDINLAGAIGTITAQTITTLCLEQNREDICPFITFNGPVSTASDITGIRLVPFNFANVKVRGIDIEASYRFNLGGGRATLRALASHYIDNIFDNGIDVAEDIAGKNQGDGVPSWNYRLTANYEVSDWSFNLTGRGFSDGVYNNNFFECTSGCPASTPANRTINNNRISGQWYVDASVTKKLTIGNSKLDVFLYVRNLLNSDPVLVGNGPTGNNTPAYPQTNRGLYDVLGRVYRMGVRFEY